MRARGEACCLGALLALVSGLLIGCAPGGSASLVALAREELAGLLAGLPPPGAETDAGLAALSDWEALPTFQDSAYIEFSSHNRQPGSFSIEPGGKDFNNFIALAGREPPLLLRGLDQVPYEGEDLGGYILAAVDDSPGYVSRMFFTRFALGDALSAEDLHKIEGLGDFPTEVLRIFVDDLAAPAFVIPLKDLGQTPPFAPPLAGRTSAALVSYAPISFTRRLRVVLGGTQTWNTYFYHVDVQRTARPGRPFTPNLAEDAAFGAAVAQLEARAGEVAGVAPEEWRWTQADVAAGQTRVLLEAEGPATLRRFTFEIESADAAMLDQLRLQVRYDAADEPAIDVPLGAFFGCREEVVPFATRAMQVAAGAGAARLHSALPMPFGESLQLQVVNGDGRPVSVRFGFVREPHLPREPWGYLHARMYEVNGPQPRGSRFEALNVTGRGRYVGTFLYAAGYPDARLGDLAGPLNLLEGNADMDIDGGESVRGTGTEDYFNAGFYFGDGPFDSAFAACNVVTMDPFELPGRVSCCRWHLLSDAIDFRRSFVLRFQYGDEAPWLVERFATVAYYYLDRPTPGDARGGSTSPP